jgi:hypothetical protein
MRLQDKVVIVTSVGSGTGLAWRLSWEEVSLHCTIVARCLRPSRPMRKGMVQTHSPHSRR